MGLSWKITKIRTIPVLVSHPKQVQHSPKRGLFLLWFFNILKCVTYSIEIWSISSRYPFITRLISGWYPDIRCTDFQQDVKAWIWVIAQMDHFHSRCVKGTFIGSTAFGSATLKSLLRIDSRRCSVSSWSGGRRGARRCVTSGLLSIRRRIDVVPSPSSRGAGDAVRSAAPADKQACTDARAVRDVSDPSPVSPGASRRDHK